MKAKRIYLVMHGEIFPQIPDSGLTSVGKEQIELIKKDLPISPSFVISGTGKRHIQTANILELKVNHYSDIVESGALMIRCLNLKYCLLSSGALIPLDKYINGFDYEKQCLQAMLRELPNESIIIGGQTTATRLGYSEPPLPSVLLLESQNDSSFVCLSQTMYGVIA